MTSLNVGQLLQNLHCREISLKYVKGHRNGEKQHIVKIDAIIFDISDMTESF